MSKLLNADYRDKGVKTRHLLHEGKIPAVLYGRGFDSISVWVNKMEFQKTIHGGAHIFELSLGGEKHIVDVQEVQRDPVTRKPIHVSFHKVKKGEILHTTIHIKFEGEAIGVKEGGVLVHVEDDLPIKGDPTSIPEYVVVDISNLKMNSNIRFKDITLPHGVSWDIEDPEHVVLACKPPRPEEEPETVELVAEGAEVAATAEAAEPAAAKDQSEKEAA